MTKIKKIKPHPHVTLAVFMVSEEKKAKLETHLISPDKICLPEHVKGMTIDLTPKFEKYGQNIAGVRVDCDIGIKTCLLTKFPNIHGREVMPYDNKFNLHISMGDILNGKVVDVLCMTPAMAQGIHDQNYRMEASTFISGEIGCQTNPVEFTIV